MNELDEFIEGINKSKKDHLLQLAQNLRVAVKQSQNTNSKAFQYYFSEGRLETTVKCKQFWNRDREVRSTKGLKGIRS